jgi:hypothetical protein
LQLLLQAFAVSLHWVWQGLAALADTDGKNDPAMASAKKNRLNIVSKLWSPQLATTPGRERRTVVALGKIVAKRKP